MTAPWYTVPDVTADAVDREISWLATAGDGGPALLAAAGGPWGEVAAYWPGNRLATQVRGLYLTRRVLSDDHVAARRYRDQYTFALTAIWPVLTPAPPVAESEQRAFDAAIGLVLQRIRGPAGDKSHGGRFLSVGEVPGQASALVDFSDPEQTIPAEKALRAMITYHADEHEYDG